MILNEAMSGHSILAQPSSDTSRIGTIELAMDALHQLPSTEAHLLATAFAGLHGDLSELPDMILGHQMFPPAGRWLGTPASLLERWLRSFKAADGSRLFTFDTDMGIDRARLADQLRRLEDDEEARALVHGGHLHDAVRLDRPFGDLTRDETDEMLCGYASVLVVIVGHFRTALLRRWSRTPMTERIPFHHEWQTLSRCMMSSVVPQASAILPVLNLPTGPASIADLPNFLAGTPLQNADFIALVERTAARLCPGVGSNAHGFDQQIARLRAAMGRLTKDVGAIRAEHLIRDGLGKMSFVQDRLDVSASRGAVLIAWSMLSAPATIRACFAAVRAGKELPATTKPRFQLHEKAIGVRKLMRATDHLRRDVMPDRESAKMNMRRSFDSTAGYAMIKRTIEAFDKTHPVRAIDALWIDPRVWFS